MLIQLPTGILYYTNFSLPLIFQQHPLNLGTHEVGMVFTVQLADNRRPQGEKTLQFGKRARRQWRPADFQNTLFLRQIHNNGTKHKLNDRKENHHQLSLPFLALREKLLNGELFGWAGGYRELRTELQRGDRGRVWPWRQGSWAGGCSIIPASVTWLLVRPELRNSPNMN